MCVYTHTHIYIIYMLLWNVWAYFYLMMCKAYPHPQFYLSVKTKEIWKRFSSVKFSHWVVSNSLWPHGLQHARLLCPSPTPGACSNSCPSSQWCHPTISSSVVSFSSSLQSCPASGSSPMSQFFTSGGQSIGTSASASVLPMNSQEWFPLGLTGLISLQAKGLSRVFSNTSSKASVLWCSAF